MSNKIRIVSSLLAVVASYWAGVQSTPLRLSTGDVLGVSLVNVKGFDGTYTVLSDGSISGLGFGELQVRGKTLAEVRRELTTAFSRRFKNPHIDLVLQTESVKHIFFVGAIAPSEPTPWRPGLTLQQGLARSNSLERDADLLEVTLFRGRQEARRFPYVDVAHGRAGQSIELEPGDVISVQPPEEIRIWMLGNVRKAGEQKLRRGVDLYEALTAAEGIDRGNFVAQDLRIVLRRGDERKVFPIEPSPTRDRVVLESGDTIYVEAPEMIKVTISGEVNEPGEMALREGTPLSTAIAAAKGKRPDATLENVFLFRQGQVQIINAAQLTLGVANLGPGLQNEDIVVVQKSQKIVYALGYVGRPHAIIIPDGKQYRASDLLAEAGGISSQGTLRRVMLIRPGTDGKLAIKRQFNLDEFLKDGNMDSNPVLEPGDILYFGQPKGVTASTALQAVSAALLLENLFRN